MAKHSPGQSFSASPTESLPAICSFINSTNRHPVNLSSIASDVQIETVARYFGGNGYAPDATTTTRMWRSVDLASQLAAPVGTFTLFPISHIISGSTIVLAEGHTLFLPECFTDSGACIVAAVIGTLGGRLENHCRELAGTGRIYEATLLDAVGTAFLDRVSDRLCRTLIDIGRRIGLSGGNRFSPGIDGYPLHRQRQLFQMADSAAVGVKLNSSCIMTPSKSISFFMILTKTADRNSGKDKCSICRLAHCQYRKTDLQQQLQKRE
jgi:hypothetical protein